MKSNLVNLVSLYGKEKVKALFVMSISLCASWSVEVVRRRVQSRRFILLVEGWGLGGQRNEMSQLWIPDYGCSPNSSPPSHHIHIHIPISKSPVIAMRWPKNTLPPPNPEEDIHPSRGR